MGVATEFASSRDLVDSVEYSSFIVAANPEALSLRWDDLVEGSHAMQSAAAKVHDERG